MCVTRKPAVRAVLWIRTVSGIHATRSVFLCQVRNTNTNLIPRHFHQTDICVDMHLHPQSGGNSALRLWWRTTVPSHTVPENVCGESWHLVGNSCLKFITAKDSYDNAKLACRGHNAVLASLTSQKKVDFVLKELHIMSMVVRPKWRCNCYFALVMILWAGLAVVGLVRYSLSSVSEFDLDLDFSPINLFFILAASPEVCCLTWDWPVFSKGHDLWGRGLALRTLSLHRNTKNNETDNEIWVHSTQLVGYE